MRYTVGFPLGARRTTLQAFASAWSYGYYLCFLDSGTTLTNRSDVSLRITNSTKGTMGLLRQKIILGNLKPQLMLLPRANSGKPGDAQQRD